MFRTISLGRADQAIAGRREGETAKAIRARGEMAATRRQQRAAALLALAAAACFAAAPPLAAGEECPLKELVWTTQPVVRAGASGWARAPGG